MEIAFGLIAVVLGFCHVWADHHYLSNADAMSYLDIAEAYLRKDWHTAVNAYWSPLYSWLIALALLLKPSSYWKFAVVHLVGFAIYLFALGCFAFLVQELVHFNRNRKDALLAGGLVMLPGWALVALGYPLFIWSSLYLIDVPLESPDMLVAAFVYLACGLLLRMRRQPLKWVPFVFLGAALGFGYLAKSVMLPMAIVFLAASLFSIGNLRRSLPRVAVAVALFLLIAVPFVFAISRAKGRLTFGDTGKLNYLWSINQIPVPHWQGELPGYGKPVASNKNECLQRLLFTNLANPWEERTLSGTTPPIGTREVSVTSTFGNNSESREVPLKAITIYFKSGASSMAYWWASSAFT